MVLRGHSRGQGGWHDSSVSLQMAARQSDSSGGPQCGVIAAPPVWGMARRRNASRSGGRRTELIAAEVLSER